MPRYYFPSWNGDSLVPDDEGIELDDMEQARLLAMQALGEMAKDILPGSPHGHALKINIMDEGNEPVLELRLTFEVVHAA